MILFFDHFVTEVLHLHMPKAFSYVSTRMILAATTSLFLTLFLFPWFIQCLKRRKIGDLIRKEDCPKLGELHAEKEDTPTMGGLLILFSMGISLLLWMDLQSPFTLILGLTTLFLGALGARDDLLKLRYKNKKGLSARKKFLAQSAVAAFVALYLLWPPLSEALHSGSWWAPPVIKEASGGDGILSLQEYASRLYIPFVKFPLFTLSGVSLVLMGLFYIVVITGSSNAVNLTDGLDGLAAGSLLLVAACFGIIAFLTNHSEIAGYLNILYVEGSGEIGVYLFAFLGACLGFLWYNGYPAEIFMGDTGSLGLGGIIGVSAVLLKREILLAIVGGIFVAEALSVIIQVVSYRYRGGKRVFLCAPLHHHFEYKGWPESKVVLRFWIIGILLAIIGLASLKLQ